MDYRHLDPQFTDYSPTTCVEAIQLFYRLKMNGEIHWDDLDVVFRRCAKDLKNQEEFDNFVSWIVNPQAVQRGALEDMFPASALYPSQPMVVEDEKVEEKAQESGGIPELCGQNS